MEDFISHYKATWRSNLYAAWLAGSISAIYGGGFFDWRIWVVLLPTIGLVSLFNDPQHRED